MRLPSLPSNCRTAGQRKREVRRHFRVWLIWMCGSLGVISTCWIGTPQDRGWYTYIYIYMLIDIDMGVAIYIYEHKCVKSATNSNLTCFHPFWGWLQLVSGLECLDILRQWYGKISKGMHVLFRSQGCNSLISCCHGRATPGWWGGS